MIRGSFLRQYSWAAGTSATEIAQFMLPSKRGTVEHITSQADLQAVRGVIEANLLLAVGDTVGGLMDSSSISGLVFAEIGSLEDLSRLQCMLERTFALSIRP